MRILIATDGSPSAEAALQAGLRLLDMAGAELSVISIASLPVTYTDGFPYGIQPLDAELYQRLYDEEEQAAKTALDHARRLLEAAGHEASYTLRWGDAAQEVIRMAEAIRPDVIVLGSHGRGALGRLLLGSVSQAVLNRWPGATLVVRTPEANPPAADSAVVEVSKAPRTPARGPEGRAPG